MPVPDDTQLDLFGAQPATAAGPPHPVLPAAVDAAVGALAERLPAGIRLGTSSWHFPGWAQLVYDRLADERTLARDGLPAYAAHPLLSCVGLDRTFHAPLREQDYRRYAEQVPAGFRFVVKAPMGCTAALVHTHPGRPLSENPHFLDAPFALAQFVAPCLAGLGDKAGPLVFQFPPVGREWASRPHLFAQRLRSFLAALPAGPLYAVELRDHALLGPAYVEALQDTGAVHCLGIHPRLPVASEQARESGLDRAGPLVARWNLHAGLAYEQARQRYAPFTRLVDEDILNRVGIARLALAAARRGEPVYVTVNNKAEGSAPLSVVKLAEQIVAAAGHDTD